MSDTIASPSVRKRAGDRGIDIDALAKELGRETITMDDLDSKGGGQAQAAPAGDTSYWDVDHSAYGPVTEEAVSRFSRTAARNLSAANTLIPQVTHHEEAEVTAIEALRSSWRDEAKARGVKLTALAFHVKALAKTLRAFPNFNASLSPDGATLYRKDFVHIGIAVDTPYGLMVPVIRDADRKGLWQLASEIADLAARAQARKIGPDEMGGASMSISSLGGIGGTAFTPIVNPPELAILGLTRTYTATRWTEGTPEPVPMLPIDLSYDHRALNGADAARFAAHLKRLIEDPRRMMI
ncbi:2-oxo acid dehydrogenase subunit E2 [Histidinibacterium aquaticum]|uniref:Dihydrolipoamide acetyltransferase n=1 Tax=Histidinibacterium aquaticum TaxID=2613962 RepID=A0A5J5GFH1_9RHOB|nr:2-oxo acid dehydrogenase subunit E2 [Histidinibacterium aquaticum]KAA9006760.1 dihydrolipoamide acetyltransferase [Histidinibacterium aquaticum]